MDLNARVDVNCGRKDGRMDGLTDGRTENRTPISHLAEAGATKTDTIFQHSLSYIPNWEEIGKEKWKGT